MKILLRSLLIVVLLSFANHAQAYPFADRYGLDSLFSLGTHAEMEKRYDQLLALTEKEYGKDKHQDAIRLALIGENLQGMGLHQHALQYAELSETCFEELFSDPANKNDAQLVYDYALLCHNLAGIHTALMISFSKSIDYYLKSAEYLDKWIEMLPPLTSKPLDKRQYDLLVKGTIWMEQGSMIMELLTHDYAGAALHADTLLMKIEEAYPGIADHTLDYNKTLIYLSNIYLRAQNYEQSLRYLTKANENISRYFGKENILYAYTLYLEASICYQLNDQQKTDHILAESLKIYQDTGHTLHADYAELLELAGHFMLGLGDYKSSAKYYDAALDIIKASSGDSCYHALVNRVFTTYPLQFERRYDEAIAIMEEVLDNDMFITNLTDDHVVSTFSNYYELSYLSGHFDNVFESVEDAEGVIESLGNNVGLGVVSKLYISIGRTYQASNRHLGACPYFNKALNSLREQAHTNFSFLPEKQRMFFWDLERTRFESILKQNEVQKADGNGEIASLLYDAALLQKGLLLNASVNMSRIIEEKAPESLKQKMRRLQLMLRSTLSTEEARNECARLEKEVQNEARQYGDFMDFTDLTWQDVRRVLTPGDVAIEFVCSEHSTSMTLSAEILSGRKKTPIHVHLLSFMKNQLSEPQFPGHIQQLIEQKVLPFLKPGDKVYFSPAGLLHTLPVEYMHLSNGKRMDKVYQMYRLSSTRQLVAERTAAASRKTSSSLFSSGKTGTIALFGGMNYNSTAEDIEMELAMADQSRSQGKSPLRTQLWSYLANTQREVTDIATLVEPTGCRVRLFTENEGLEEHFKGLSESRTSIIHIATHGYYEASASVNMDNAGLIFTGANKYWLSSAPLVDGVDDGILKASEIANLNLIGTDLVVLSACQTGLGNITGEGVFGLQRAFKKAGAQSLLMSLWQVDDEATQILMTSFYRNLLKGYSKHQSLRLAQAEICAHTFHRNGQTISGSNPHFWAAFILID